MPVVVVVVVLFDLTLRDALFLFSTRLDVSSSPSPSSSCRRRRRRRRLRRRRRQHPKHAIPWCYRPLGPSPNGGHTSCVFALSYVTTWLKAQDLHCRRTTFVLSFPLVCFTCRRRRCRPVRPDALSTPFLLLTDSTRPVVVVFVVIVC